MSLKLKPQIKLGLKPTIRATIRTASVLEKSHDALLDWVEQEFPILERIEGEDRPGSPCSDAVDPPGRADVEAITRGRKSSSGGREIQSRTDENESRDPFENVASPGDLQTIVRYQLGLLKLEGAQRDLALRLIEELDQDGFLRVDLSALAAETGVERDAAEGLVKMLQGLDPPGVFARDVSERLHGIWAEDATPLMLAVINGIHLLAAGPAGREQLARTCGVSVKEVLHVVDVIRTRPYLIVGGDAVLLPPTRADVVVERRTNEDLIVTEMEVDRPRFRWKPPAVGRRLRAHELRWLQQQAWRADGLQQTLRFRRRAVVAIAQAVVDVQRAHLIEGAPLTVLTQAQVAAQLGFADSTVSRAVRDRYLLFEGRLIELQSLFNAQVTFNTFTSNAQIVVFSPDQVRAYLATLIDGEDKARPLSDDQLSIRIELDRGWPVAKRTITKYRRQLGIPNQSGRRFAT